MSNSLVCWRCGASLGAFTLPFSRFDACKVCGAELHACKQCRFFKLTVANQCQEPVAEEVRDKHRSNVCGYFVPAADAFHAAESVSNEASSALASLFGDLPTQQSGGEATVQTQVKQKADAAAEARAKLEALFNSKQ